MLIKQPKYKLLRHNGIDNITNLHIGKRYYLIAKRPHYYYIFNTLTSNNICLQSSNNHKHEIQDVSRETF